MAKNTKASSNAREPRCAILKPSTPCFRTQRLLAGDNAAGISRLDLEIDALRQARQVELDRRGEANSGCACWRCVRRHNLVRPRGRGFWGYATHAGHRLRDTATQPVIKPR